MRRFIPVLTVFFLIASPAAAQTYELSIPDLVLTSVRFDAGAKVVGDSLDIDAFTAEIEGRSYELEQDDSGAWVAEGLTYAGSGRVEVKLLRNSSVVATATARSMYGWLSILPPFLAILIALLFRRVIPALFLGLWVGAMLAIGVSLNGMWLGLLETLPVYILGALTTPDKAAVILFSFMIGGMVGIISKNGGMQGVVNQIVKWAKSPRRGQVATGVLGLLIFFDEYANSLVVGNTMRSVTDRLRISREKLAYIVD